jgi:invasion protein IalB
MTRAPALAALTLAAALAAAGCSAATQTAPSGAQTATAQPYRSECSMGADPYAQGTWDPQVIVTNTGAAPLSVLTVHVAVMGPDGAQITSVDVAPHLPDSGVIAPGQSDLLNWIPGDFTVPGGSAGDTCQVEDVS